MPTYPNVNWQTHSSCFTLSPLSLISVCSMTGTHLLSATISIDPHNCERLLSTTIIACVIWKPPVPVWAKLVKGGRLSSFCTGDCFNIDLPCMGRSISFLTIALMNKSLKTLHCSIMGFVFFTFTLSCLHATPGFVQPLNLYCSK